MDSCPVLLGFYRTVVQWKYWTHVQGSNLASYRCPPWRRTTIGITGALARHTMTGMIASFAKSNYHWHNVNLLQRLLFQGLPKTLGRATMSGITWTSANVYYHINFQKCLLRLALRKPLRTPTMTRLTYFSGEAYYNWHYGNLYERLLWQGLHKTL